MQKIITFSLRANSICATKCPGLHEDICILFTMHGMLFRHIITHGFISNNHPVVSKVKNRMVSGLSSNNCRFVSVLVGVTMPTAFITPGSIATLAECYGWVAIQQCVWRLTYYCKQHPPFCTTYLVYRHNNEQLLVRLLVMSSVCETRLSSARLDRSAIPATNNDYWTSIDAKNIIILAPASVFNIVWLHMKYKKRNHLLFRATFPAVLLI